VEIQHQQRHYEYGKEGGNIRYIRIQINTKINMEKISKVKNVTGNGTWESKYGIMFKFELEMENGDIGEYNSKTSDQTKFVVGNEVAYTITSREYNGVTYYTIKPAETAAPAQSFSKGKVDGDTGKKIARMSVLKCATDLVVHEKINIDKLFEYAQIMEKYVESGELPHMDGSFISLNHLPF
jgi:hypothetical protein